MLELLRMMFPYMLLACLAAVLIGMANARGHFFVPALGAALLNVVMIASVLWLAPRLGKPLEVRIFGLAIGVLLAGPGAGVSSNLPSLHREGLSLSVGVSLERPDGAGGGPQDAAGIHRRGRVSKSTCWSRKCSRSGSIATTVATFNYSVRLMELPQGVFGISLATYLLPTLAGLAAEKKFSEFKDTLRQGMGLLAFTNLFAAAISIALAVPIVRLLFERGLFGPDATQRVAISLACLAPGLLMFSLNNILARAFYALKDIGTPMKISVVCLVLNLAFSCWLVPQYREAGLGVANTVTAAVNTSLLIYALRRKLKEFALGVFSRNLLVLVGGRGPGRSGRRPRRRVLGIAVRPCHPASENCEWSLCPAWRPRWSMAALPCWDGCRPQQKFQTWSGNGSVESGRPSPASGIHPGHLQGKRRVLVHLCLEDVHRLLDQFGAVPGEVVASFGSFATS